MFFNKLEHHFETNELEIFEASGKYFVCVRLIKIGNINNKQQQKSTRRMQNVNERKMYALMLFTKLNVLDSFLFIPIESFYSNPVCRLYKQKKRINSKPNSIYFNAYMFVQSMHCE